jgi:hypothetical protein
MVMPPEPPPISSTVMAGESSSYEQTIIRVSFFEKGILVRYNPRPQKNDPFLSPGER